MGKVLPFGPRLVKPYTVGMLRKALEGVDDSLFILVQAVEETEEGDNQICAGVSEAQVDSTCLEDEAYVFRIFANDSDLDLSQVKEASDGGEEREGPEGQG